MPTLCNVPNPPAKLALKRKLPQRVELEQPAEKSPRLIEATTPSVNDGASTSTYSTPLCMDTSTPTAAKYKRMEQKMWKLQKRLQQMRKTIKLLPNVSRLKLARSEKSKHAAKVDVAMNIIKDMVPTTTLQLIHSQLVLSVAKTRGKRFTRKDKIVALGVYYYSQKAYKYLATILRLPSIRTLQRMLENFQMAPGFHEQVFTTLKHKVAAMSELDKYCAIVFDEMAIKSEMCYSSKTDSVEGLEDFGILGRTKYVANSVVVFSIRGLKNKWKQPVGYFLTSGAINSNILNDLTHMCIRKLRDVGLIPKVLICDQGPNNRKFLKHVTRDSPIFTEKYPDRIYVVYDRPHLIKNIRNNFKRNTLSMGGENVCWDYVVSFFEFDRSQSNRLAPKLTKKHINIPAFKEMRVNLATQVMSHTVAAGMTTLKTLGKLPENAETTIEFISFFN